MWLVYVGCGTTSTVRSVDAFTLRELAFRAFSRPRTRAPSPRVYVTNSRRSLAKRGLNASPSSPCSPLPRTRPPRSTYVHTRLPATTRIRPDCSTTYSRFRPSGAEVTCVGELNPVRTVTAAARRPATGARARTGIFLRL